MSDKVYKLSIQNPKMGEWIDELARTLVPLGFEHQTYTADEFQRLGIAQVGTFGGYPIIRPPKDFYRLFNYNEEIWIGSARIKKTDKKKKAGHNFVVLYTISAFRVENGKLQYIRSIKTTEAADEWLVSDDNPIRLYNEFKKIASNTQMTEDDFDILDI